MNEINWDPIMEPIEEHELTKEEKVIAEECSKIEMEFQEIISSIGQNFKE